MLSPVENDLQVQVVPGIHGEQPFQVVLGLHHTFSAGQSPSLRETMNVGVDWKRWNPKRLRHHHTGGFVADPRK